MREVEVFRFDDAATEELCATFTGNVSDLIGQLEGIATQYLQWEAQEPTSRPTTRQHLRQVESAARALYKSMLTMDDEAEFQMCLSAAAKDSHRGVRWAMALRSELPAISAACADASSSLGRRPNKTANGELAWTIEQLVKLFNENSEKRFTHTKSEMGEPTSKGGKFIVKFFAAVDPRVTPQAITSQLQARSRRCRRKSAANR